MNVLQTAQEKNNKAVLFPLGFPSNQTPIFLPLFSDILVFLFIYIIGMIDIEVGSR
jgi:hypothetical protein